MTARIIIKDFETYGKSRIRFCEQMANHSSNTDNINFMLDQGALDLLVPLVDDPFIAVQQNAITCLSRMANTSARVANLLIEHNVHANLVKLLSDKTRADSIYFKKAVLLALNRLSKHSISNANDVIEVGGLNIFIDAMQEQNVTVKEAGACGLGSIISKSEELANLAINQGAIPVLVMCLQHSDINLKNISALVLGDIAGFSFLLAREVCECAAITHLARCLENLDMKIKRNCMFAMANIAKHNLELAQNVIEGNVFPRVLIHLNHDNSGVQKQAARLVQEIVKHSLETAQLIVNSGGIGALTQLVSAGAQCAEDVLTPAVTALGYIAGQSPHFALAVIECKGVFAIVLVMKNETLSDEQLCACIWTLGHIGKHSPEHSKTVAETNIFNKIVEIYEDPKSSCELKKKCKCCLKLCLQCCLYLPALEPLLSTAPPQILKYILAQYAKVLPHDICARRLFITTGGLKKVLEIEAEAGSPLYEIIATINACYPEDIIRYYTPEFPEIILQRVDEFQPKPPPELKPSTGVSDSCIDLIKQQQATPEDAIAK